MNGYQRTEEVIDKKIIQYVNNIVNLLDIPVENGGSKDPTINHWMLAIEEDMISSNEDTIELKYPKSHLNTDKIKPKDKVILINKVNDEVKCIINIIELKEVENIIHLTGKIIKIWRNIKIADIVKEPGISYKLKEEIKGIKGGQ